MNEPKERSYTLQVKGNVAMQDMKDSFATNGIYTLFYKGHNVTKPELKEYILEEKEVELKSLDANTTQLLAYVNKIGRIYSRQHICVNDDGVIKGLLNLTEIKNKWEILKKELMQVNPINAFEIIRHKDRELSNPAELIDNLAHTHFMYLFLYPKSGLPDLSGHKSRRIERDRMGIGFSLPIEQTFTAEKTENGYRIHTEGVLDQKGRIDKVTITKVTGQKELDIKHSTEAIHTYDQTGELLSAEMSVIEQLNSDYKAEIHLNLQTV